MKQNRTINLPKLGGELEGSGITFSYAEIHCHRNTAPKCASNLRKQSVCANCLTV